MIDYLKEKKFLEEMSNQRQKSIELEIDSFVIINEQLYKRGKDLQLRICDREDEYINILEQWVDRKIFFCRHNCQSYNDVRHIVAYIIQ